MKLHVYHLSTCDTCKRIIKSLNLPKETTYQDIKKQHLSKKELKVLREHVGSYKDLLNTRAQKLRDANHDLEKMTEDELRDLILSHYTFLKRPIFLFSDRVFIGNAKRNIADLSAFLS